MAGTALEESKLGGYRHQSLPPGASGIVGHAVGKKHGRRAGSLLCSLVSGRLEEGEDPRNIRNSSSAEKNVGYRHF